MSTKYKIEKLEIAKLELKDGDILAVKVNGNPSAEKIERVRSDLKKILPSRVSVLVFFSDDVELKIIAQTDGESVFCPHGRRYSEICEPCGRFPDLQRI